MFELDCAALLAGGHLNKHQRADVAVCKIANFVSATDRSTQLVPGVTWVQQQATSRHHRGWSSDNWHPQV
jgi:hypothetical protein